MGMTEGPPEPTAPETPAAPAPSPPPSNRPRLGNWIGVALIVFAVGILLVTAVFLAGLTGPAGFTGVRVSATGCWTGTVTSGLSTEVVDGCEDQDIAFVCDGSITAIFNKMEGDSSTLSVEIAVSGQNVASSSTFLPYGVATTSATC